MYFEKNMPLINFNDSKVKPPLKLKLLEKVIVKGEKFILLVFLYLNMKNMVSISILIRIEANKPQQTRLQTTYSLMDSINTKIIVGQFKRNKNGSKIPYLLKIKLISLLGSMKEATKSVSGQKKPTYWCIKTTKRLRLSFKIIIFVLFQNMFYQKQLVW